MARFTAANAREMAAKAHASRQHWLAGGRLTSEAFPRTLEAGPHQATNDYVSRRLARVRKQLDCVDRAIETEASKATPDGQNLNWLAQAQERLAEQERILAQRPLPGSRQPRDQTPVNYRPIALTADEAAAMVQASDSSEAPAWPVSTPSIPLSEQGEADPTYSPLKESFALTSTTPARRTVVSVGRAMVTPNPKSPIRG